jgi:mRNA-degrading endonuclease toxin of MazEF toxin-antitoxin module
VPGNLALSARLTGLPKDSVANVSQIVTLDRDLLTGRVGKLPRQKLELLSQESTLSSASSGEPRRTGYSLN